MKSFSLLILIILIAITGCSTRKVYPKSHSNHIQTQLYQEYKRWKHTPYQYGGNTLRGADCSGFVQQVYANALNKRVPRTTLQQAKIGYKIGRNSLRAGDLILFRTGRGVRHSGIMLDKNRFMHSSSSHGVIISSLKPYWIKHYWQARRILP